MMAAEEMAMFGSMHPFTNQFAPVEDGYVYYPSRKSGGKFVSSEEYDRLLANWRRVAGLRPFLIGVGLMVFVMNLGIFAQVFLDLPFWINWIVLAAIIAALFAWLLPPSRAPLHLVKSRPVVTPPRPAGQPQRQARAVIPWPFVILILVGSGSVFANHIGSPDRSPVWWAWTLVSGVIFAAYSWLGIQKLVDRRHQVTA
jgi:hypothetical protein